MKVYFYHTQDLNMIHRKWKEGLFPGHFLYGATHLPQEGIDVVLHRYKPISNRVKLMLYVTWRVLTCREHFDAIYATHTAGLELIVFLHALHLYTRPIIVWHHQPIVKSDNSFREMMAHVFYRGLDHMFFFSEKLLNDSLKSTKANEERMQVCPWGADLDTYDRLTKSMKIEEHVGFVSTGKEKRDMPTLIRAFSATGQELNIYIAYNACGDNYVEILNDLRPSSNIHINFIRGFIPNELAKKVWSAKFVAICCQETNYTVGLTTLVEALAFGMPVISTRNKSFPFDIDKEGVGITVPYYDSVAWEKAIRFLVNNPEEAEKMGKKARELAEKTFNITQCTHVVAEAIKKFDKHHKAKKDGEINNTSTSAANPVVVPSAIEPSKKSEEIATSVAEQTVEAGDLKNEAEEKRVQMRAQYRMPKEIEDFYADIPQTRSNTTVRANEGQDGNVRLQNSSNDDHRIISVNTEELKARLKGFARICPSKSRMKGWIETTKDYLPQWEQVKSASRQLKAWIMRRLSK